MQASDSVWTQNFFSQDWRGHEPPLSVRMSAIIQKLSYSPFNILHSAALQLESYCPVADLVISGSKMEWTLSIFASDGVVRSGRQHSSILAGCSVSIRVATTKMASRSEHTYGERCLAWVVRLYAKLSGDETWPKVYAMKQSLISWSRR